MLRRLKDIFWPPAKVERVSEVVLPPGTSLVELAEFVPEHFAFFVPDGRLIVLEASSIPWRPLHAAYLGYMSLCMPALGWLATGAETIWPHITLRL